MRITPLALRAIWHQKGGKMLKEDLVKSDINEKKKVREEDTLIRGYSVTLLSWASRFALLAGIFGCFAP